MQMIQPRNAVELIKAVRSIQGEGYLVAGCTDFLARRNGTWWDADCLIDLLGVKDMQGIYRTDQAIRIGAVCTHSEIENHPVVRAGCPALSQACSEIGSKQIRNRGTIGGNLCSAYPTGDIYPVLLAVRAEILCMNLAGNLRKIPAEKFISGKGTTILQPGEAVIRIEIPLAPAGSRSAFAKLGERKTVTTAKISLSLASEIWKGCLLHPRISLGAVSEAAFLSDYAASAVEGAPMDESLSDELWPILSDEIAASIPHRASMPYKKEAVRGLTEDLIMRFLSDRSACS